MKIDFAGILKVLSGHNVEFIVGGGVAAAMRGVPLNTFDIDVVHRRTAENVDRLLAALDALDAGYRLQAERKLRPQSSHLMSEGRQLLLTQLGPLDLPGAVGLSHTMSYEDLLPFTDLLPASKAGEVRVLRLEKLIEPKAELGNEKDAPALPVYRRVLMEKESRSGSD